MGAAFQTTTLTAKDQQALRRAFDDLVAKEAHENGHGGYTGSFAEAPGLDIHDRVFTNKEAAVEYIDTHAEKWGNAIAVRLELADLEAAKKAIEKNAAVKRATKAYEKANALLLAKSEAFAAARSVSHCSAKSNAKLITCGSCGSKVSKEHVNNHVCPVCRTEGGLAGKASVKRIAKAKAAWEAATKGLIEARNALQDAKDAVTATVPRAKNSNLWIVGGVFAS